MYVLCFSLLSLCNELIMRSVNETTMIFLEGVYLYEKLKHESCGNNMLHCLKKMHCGFITKIIFRIDEERNTADTDNKNILLQSKITNDDVEI